MITYMSSFSHYGATSVDLAAPGSDILSTFPTYETPAMEYFWSVNIYFTGAGSDPNYNMFAHTYTWQIATLEPGAEGSVSLTVEAGANAEPLSLIENLAVIYTDIGNGYARTETKVECWGGDIVYVDRNTGGQYRIGTSWAYAYDDLQTAVTEYIASTLNRQFINV